MVVQSALGEPLRAEIDILEMSADEASSLRASIASPEVFRAAGLDYNPALANTRVSLQRRSNGRSFIRLSSDRSVTEPFVDLILEASWSNGRIVRDYTMLLDPPSLRAPAPMAIAAPAAETSPVGSASAAPAGSQLAPAPSAPRDRLPARDKIPGSSGKPLRTSGETAAKPAPLDAAGGKQVTVQAGDTATRIALANKPKEISLDQMLVALLRSNPNAFINDNVNRLKKGAVINLPSAEQAASVPAKEASQLVVASSSNFGEFRKKMAAVAPAVPVASASRSSSGSVQTRVDDKKPAAAAPDKLTLAQGSVQSNTQAAQAAQAAASKDAAARAAEINRNVADLSKLAAASSAASSAAPALAVASSAPVAQAPVAPASAASAPKPAASRPAVVKALPPPPEPTFIEQLTENPLVPAAGAGLVALLAGFGVYRFRQRKQAESADSSFLDSRLQPDSFFGTSGGQKVDTTDSANGSSSIVYSASQLDGADDVDPVAEADVYLAYGRDLQAEEILKEALKTNPGRLAVHQKLLEIYGKRRDTRNFELTASEAFKITGGEGQDWIRITEQGQGLDPGNQLYLPGGQPAVAVGIPSQPMPLEMKAGMQAAPSTATASAGGAALGAAAAGLATVSLGNRADPDATTSSLNAQPASAGGVDLDFDLDFSLDDDDNAKVITEMGAPESTSKIAPVAGAEPALDMNFDLPAEATQALAADSHTKPGVIEFDLPALGELSKSGEVSGPVPLEASHTIPFVEEAEEFKKEAALSFGATQSGTLGLIAKPGDAPGVDQLAAMVTAPGALEFDLGNLSLEIGNSVLPPDAAGAASTGEADPLATKLALADEFNSIGDTDGARALIEEVIAEANGELKAKAQKALAALA